MPAVEILAEVYATLVCYSTILLAIELMFCLPNLPRRRRFGRRAALVLPAYALLVNSHILTRPISTTWLMAPFGLFVFLASLLVLAALFDASWQQVFFYGTASYAVEGILFVARNMEIYFPGFATLDPVSSYLVTLALCALVLLLVWRLLVRRYRNGAAPDFRNGYLLLFVSATLLVSNLLSTWVRVELLTSAPYALCSLLCYVLLLALEFDVFRVSALEHERDLMRQLSRERERQQAAAQESIEAVNIKFHDLKHQISALRRETGERRERGLDELERSVERYDTAVRTGDDAIDAILTEKSEQCWARGIEFTCMVDGASLAALGVVDAYTLLGNALDNAIEAAEKVSEAAGRVVALRAERRADLSYVCVENSCVGAAPLVDGLPQTTKADPENHGFGLRSIGAVLARHGGHYVIDSSDGRFSLSMFFPVASGER